MYRPGNHTFYIHNLTGTGTHSHAVYGTPGDKPFTGNFQNNATTDNLGALRY